MDIGTFGNQGIQYKVRKSLTIDNCVLYKTGFAIQKSQMRKAKRSSYKAVWLPGNRYFVSLYCHSGAISEGWHLLLKVVLGLYETRVKAKILQNMLFSPANSVKGEVFVLLAAEWRRVGAPLASYISPLNSWASGELGKRWSTIRTCTAGRLLWPRVNHQGFSKLLSVSKVTFTAIVCVLTRHYPIGS